MVAGPNETSDDAGRRIYYQKFAELDPGEVDRLWKRELGKLDQVQLLRSPLPSVARARQAIAAGKPAVEDEIAMLLHFQKGEQWDRMMEHLERAEKLSGKPGMRGSALPY